MSTKALGIESKPSVTVSWPWKAVSGLMRRFSQQFWGPASSGEAKTGETTLDLVEPLVIVGCWRTELRLLTPASIQNIIFRSIRLKYNKIMGNGTFVKKTKKNNADSQDILNYMYLNC